MMYEMKTPLLHREHREDTSSYNVWFLMGLAVTPGHNFYSAVWSQTASHNPKHQNPHTLFFSCLKNTLSFKFAYKFLSSQTLLHLGTPTANYSGDTS
jgi:hypothetical protein